MGEKTHSWIVGVVILHVPPPPPRLQPPFMILDCLPLTILILPTTLTLFANYWADLLVDSTVNVSKTTATTAYSSLYSNHIFCGVYSEQIMACSGCKIDKLLPWVTLHFTVIKTNPRHTRKA